MNKTSRELTKARRQSLRFHDYSNDKLYKEYKESGAEFQMSFAEFKRNRPKSKKRWFNKSKK